MQKLPTLYIYTSQ